MSRHDENRELTKKKLTDAFWDLYREKDIHEIRIKDITDRAGYHRATFYLYFTDIYSLLSGEIDDMFSYIKSAGLDFENISLEESVEIMASCYDKYQDKLVLMLGIRYNNEFTEKIKQTTYKGIRKNLGLDDTPRSEIICDYAVRGTQAALCSWYEHKDSMTMAELTELIQNLLLNGVVEERY